MLPSTEDRSSVQRGPSTQQRWNPSARQAPHRASPARFFQYLVALLVLIAAGSMGCEAPPAVGVLCKRDAAPVCDGADRMFACVDTHWLLVPCRGGPGCSGSPARCDATVARVGDACLASATRSGESCSEDRGEVLVCEQGTFVAARACRGPKKCEPGESGKVACDETVTVVGEPCSIHDSRLLSCSPDGKAVIECNVALVEGRRRGATDGVTRLQRECPTVAGCKQGPSWAYCDFTGSTAGTPCGKGNENREFCSPDRKAVMKCDPATLTLQEERKCPAGDCKVSDVDGRTESGCPR